jgi:hypothetical protein
MDLSGYWTASTQCCRDSRRFAELYLGATASPQPTPDRRIDPSSYGPDLSNWNPGPYLDRYVQPFVARRQKSDGSLTMARSVRDIEMNVYCPIILSKRCQAAPGPEHGNRPMTASVVPWPKADRPVPTPFPPVRTSAISVDPLVQCFQHLTEAAECLAAEARQDQKRIRCLARKGRR